MSFAKQFCEAVKLSLLSRESFFSQKIEEKISEKIHYDEKRNACIVVVENTPITYLKITFDPVNRKVIVNTSTSEKSAVKVSVDKEVKYVCDSPLPITISEKPTLWVSYAKVVVLESEKDVKIVILR